jgi:diacylglycerol kinase family enzyme
LLNAGRPDVAFAVIPIGSANDYAYSLESESHQGNAGERWVDVGLVRDSTGRKRYFVCCLGLGFNGMVTLESRKIKRLQGIALYGLATLRALWYHHACPPMEVSIDDQPPATLPTLMLSILVGQREGGFVLAPKARLDDGLFDFVHAGDLSRWEVLKLLPRLALTGTPECYPKVRLGQCKRIALHSPAPLAVHVDGEFFAKPDDNVCRLEVAIVPRSLKIRGV